MVGDDRIIVGDRVIAHGHTFSASGVVVDCSGRQNLKVRLDEPRPDLPGDTPWFDRAEVEREPGLDS